MRIRELTVEDAEAVGRIWTASRMAAYRGIVPDAVAETGPEALTNGFAESFAKTGSFGFVAEDESGPVGFAIAGDANKEQPEYESELSLIYVLPEAQGRGLGRMLVHAIADGLVRRNVRSMLLWTIGANQLGRAFYDGLGGTVIARKWSDKNNGWVVAYGWRDVSVLLGRTAPRA